MTRQTQEEIDAWIAREVAKAPPLRIEQRRRLARLFTPREDTTPSAVSK